MLRSEPLTKESAVYDQFIKIYTTEFPGAELTPPYLLFKRANKDYIDFLAYFDEELFVGFSFCVKHNDLVFIMYLAVNSEIQSKGYGSRILQQVELDNPDCRIVLEIQSPHEDADNSEQRLRREAFYLKNGFVPAGYKIINSGIIYDVLVKNGSCTKKELSEIYKLNVGFLMHLISKLKFI